MRTGNNRQGDFQFWNPPKKKTLSKTTQKSRRITPDGKFIEYEFDVEIPLTKKQVEKIMLRRFLRKAMAETGKHNYAMNDEFLEEFNTYLWILDVVPKIQRQIGSIVKKSEDLVRSGNTEFSPAIKRKIALMEKLAGKFRTIDAYYAEEKKKKGTI